MNEPAMVLRYITQDDIEECKISIVDNKAMIVASIDKQSCHEILLFYTNNNNIHL